MPTPHGTPKPLLPLALATLTSAPVLLALALPHSNPGNAAPPAATPADATAADPAGPVPSIDFNRDIRPILTDRCFTCHGPDSAAREKTGGLRLDSFEAATATLPHAVTPIVPGDAAASEAIRRVKAADPDVRMPPPESHLTLSPAEITLLERWINEGAHYDTHWSFKPITSPPVPAEAVDPNGEGEGEWGGWSRNEIDRFILARLDRVFVDGASSRRFLRGCRRRRSVPFPPCSTLPGHCHGRSGRAPSANVWSSWRFPSWLPPFSPPRQTTLLPPVPPLCAFL